MWIVFDYENDQAFGPYDSEEEAEADLIEKALKGSWTDVLEAATHSGWLTDKSTGLTGNPGLIAVELQSKEPNLRYSI